MAEAMVSACSRALATAARRASSRGCPGVGGFELQVCDPVGARTHRQVHDLAGGIHFREGDPDVVFSPVPRDGPCPCALPGYLVFGSERIPVGLNLQPGDVGTPNGSDDSVHFPGIFFGGISRGLSFGFDSEADPNQITRHSELCLPGDLDEPTSSVTDIRDGRRVGLSQGWGTGRKKDKGDQREGPGSSWNRGFYSSFPSPTAPDVRQVQGRQEQYSA